MLLVLVDILLVFVDILLVFVDISLVLSEISLVLLAILVAFVDISLVLSEMSLVFCDILLELVEMLLVFVLILLVLVEILVSIVSKLTACETDIWPSLVACALDIVVVLPAIACVDPVPISRKPEISISLRPFLVNVNVPPLYDPPLTKLFVSSSPTLTQFPESLYIFNLSSPVL